MSSIHICLSRVNRYEQTRKLAVPVLESLSADPEPLIRQHLCYQISLIAKFCVTEGREEGYKAVLDIILPVIAHLLEDEKAEVSLLLMLFALILLDQTSSEFCLAHLY